MTGIIFFLYNSLFFVLLLAFLFSLPLWVLIFRRRLGLKERLGCFVPRRHFSGRLIMLHAASLGELNAITPLCYELKRRFQARLVLTTLTIQARDLARQRKLVDEARLAPFDFYPLVLYFFRRRRPDLIIVAETGSGRPFIKRPLV